MASIIEVQSNCVPGGIQVENFKVIDGKPIAQGAVERQVVICFYSFC